MAAATTGDARTASDPNRRRRALTGRVGAPVSAGWGAATGVAPHVLHHVGPLAGAAIFAGATGTALFGMLGILIAIPFLRRLYRRFGTWLAPAIALLVFVAAFAFSSLVVGPAISGSEQPSNPQIQQPAGHASHHGG